MKKCLILALMSSTIFFTLTAENVESDLYYKSFPLLKVLPSTQGYQITYMKSDYTLHTFYAPIEWFIGGSTKKGEVLYGEGKAYPYCAVFWENGEFIRLKLYFPQSRLHESWGDFPKDRDYTEEFNVDEPQLEF